MKKTNNYPKSKNKSFAFYTKPEFPPLHKRKDEYSLAKLKAKKLIKLFREV